jgi:hypothetical protein
LAHFTGNSNSINAGSASNAPKLHLQPSSEEAPREKLSRSVSKLNKILGTKAGGVNEFDIFSASKK